MVQPPRLFVTLEGYAVEGGFDRPFEPATCYNPTIALGRHAGPGDAYGLWQNYERVIDVVPDIGFDGVRLSVEWARIEPRRGQLDEEALERYVRVGRHVRSLGLGLTVVLIDAAWPAWLGLEAWLLPWVVPDVLAHARRVVSAFGADTGIIVFANPDSLVSGGYRNATAPPWRRRARVDAAMATRHIGSITQLLREDPLVGPTLVSTWSTISVEESPDALASRRASQQGGELYVRSLVKGFGPTSAPSGVLEPDGARWRIAAAPELLRALR
jgi:beta-glucosidase/6-phospho-beta-glucosidase/beta-galactosidase